VFFRLLTGKYATEETRNYKRFNMLFLVKYMVENDPERREKIANAANLGAGGVLFTASERLELGTRVIVKIAFPFIQNAVEGVGKVVRVTKVKKGIERYITGVAFADLNQEIKVRLEDTINNLAKKDEYAVMFEKPRKVYKRKKSKKKTVKNKKEKK